MELRARVQVSDSETRQALVAIKKHLETVITSAAFDPTVNDDVTTGFQIGFRWINKSNHVTYICTGNSPGAARWQQIFGTNSAAGEGGSVAGPSGLDGANDYIGVYDVSADRTVRSILNDIVTAGGGAALFSAIASQALTAPSTIVVTDGKPYTPVTSASGITLTSEPTIGVQVPAVLRNGQFVVVKNTGGSNIILQDVNALGGSKLRLTANQLTIAPGGSLPSISSTPA